MSDKQAKDKRKGKPGRPPSHGGYSVIIRAGELPKRRTYIRAYLQEAHDNLTRDLGPREEDLTAAQRVLIDRAVSKLAVIRCIEEHVKETGVFKGKELSPVLAQRVTDAEKAMIPIIETLAGHVKTVRILRDKCSQWSFKERQQTKAREEEIKGKYEAAKKQLHEIRKIAGTYSQHTPFLKDVDVFLGNLERHLKDEDPKTFHLNRF